MILGIFLKLILDIINKGLKISKILSKKDFNFWLYNKSDVLGAVLVLNSPKTNSDIKK